MNKILPLQIHQKTSFHSHNLNTVPENLGGNDFQEKDIKQPTSLVHNTDNSVDIDAKTEIVHIGRKSHNECTLITTISNRSQKTLWDSGGLADA